MSVENRPPNLENLDNCASRLRRDEEADANGVTSDEDVPAASPSVSPLASIDGGDDSPTSDDMPDAMTASYSEIYQEGDNDDDLLPGEISDLAEVQDATLGINELVDQINREEREGTARATSSRANSSSRPQSLGVKAAKPHQSSRLPSAMTDSQITSPGSSMMSAEEAFEDSPLLRHGATGGVGLSDLAGTLTYEGDMVSFVAEDLQEKIKLSSPVSKVAEPFPSSCSSTSSLCRQMYAPHIAPIDPSALADLEEEARTVAASVETLLESLTTAMHGISSMTVDCMRLYEKGISKTCDVADSNIKAMYQLMAKFEELSNSMRPLDGLVAEVKSIKKLLDHFENAVEGRI
ncbi:BLOC-1-related complex subunit 6 isoform X1 [Dermacentor albipictus]|uniref:BLOC-1-related complex subunit 6 isoform X1 n=1 Tax=Dermacentor albipictus TaxID=60249 RepID=UPI0031FE3C06